MGLKDHRDRQLERAVVAIRRHWGSHAIQKARVTGSAIHLPAIPTGFPEVDRITGVGGLLRGKIAELIGYGTAGQFTVVARTLGRAQRMGQPAAYLDLDHAVDLDGLARCGVDFDSLVILRPFSFEHGLEMVRDLLREEGVGLVAFDRIHASSLLSERGGLERLDRALREWNPILHRSLCTLIFLTETTLHYPYPPASPLAHFASLRLSLERQGWLYHGGRAIGFTSRVTVLKNRSGPPGRWALIQVNLVSPLGANEHEEDSLPVDPPFGG